MGVTRRVPGLICRVFFEQHSKLGVTHATAVGLPTSKSQGSRGLLARPFAHCILAIACFRLPHFQSWRVIALPNSGELWDHKPVPRKDSSERDRLNWRESPRQAVFGFEGMNVSSHHGHSIRCWSTRFCSSGSRRAEQYGHTTTSNAKVF